MLKGFEIDVKKLATLPLDNPKDESIRTRIKLLCATFLQENKAYFRVLNEVPTQKDLNQNIGLPNINSFSNERLPSLKLKRGRRRKQKKNCEGRKRPKRILVNLVNLTPSSCAMLWSSVAGCFSVMCQ